MLSGTVLLLLGDRTIRVEVGEAAEFSTMTPHAFGAVDGPAEILGIFDHGGQRAHLHGPHRAASDADDGPDPGPGVHAGGGRGESSGSSVLGAASPSGRSRWRPRPTCGLWPQPPLGGGEQSEVGVAGQPVGVRQHAHAVAERARPVQRHGALEAPQPVLADTGVGQHGVRR